MSDGFDMNEHLGESSEYENSEYENSEYEMKAFFGQVPRAEYTASFDPQHASFDPPKPAAIYSLNRWRSFRAVSAIAAAALIAVGVVLASGQGSDEANPNQSGKRLASSDESISRGSLPGEHMEGESVDARKFVVVSNPNMVMMNDIEMFDQVGNAPTRLIADWGR